MNSISKLLQTAQTAFNKQKYNEAEKWLNKVLDLDPSNANAHHTLGLIAFTTGRVANALEHLGKAAENNKNNPQILYNHASVLLETGQYSNALKIFNKVLNLTPEHIPSLHKCSVIMGKMGNLKLAERMCKLIINLDPSHAEAHNNLGNTYKDQGRIEEAITTYKKALALKHDYITAGSNLLLCLTYSNRDPKTVFDEHREWEKRIAGHQFDKKSTPQTINHDKARIHIGYVSEDFRIHSVGYFIEPIIENHDKTQFKIFCYADIAKPDSTTGRIKRNASEWRSIYNVDDKEVIKMIEEDEIDILVDLAGHSGDNRLSLFLNKPAPIQVAYLGYPNTTGLSTMDYRLTDERADPAGQDRFYTEKLYRLPEGFLCYRPPENVPPVAKTPALENGYITFGSFNNLPKISPDAIKVWSEILNTVNNSRLVIKTKPFNDPEVMKHYKDLFIQYGIETERLIFNGHSPSTEEHLKWYGRIDIALDTFPYNGTTTTCEALLMGVPVITLVGNRHACRVGNSILSRIGLFEMTAHDKKGYIEIASNLTNNINKLSKLRSSLRNELLKSPLCNGASFTQTLEKSYKEMVENFRK